MSEPALNYRVEGQGPALLLVHGFGISFNIWREMLPFLTPHFTVVALELPGIGASPLPPEGSDYLEVAVSGIEALRERLGIENWSVLGYSTGSRIAEAYIRADTAPVCRAMFLCPLLIDQHKDRALKFGLRLDSRSPGFGRWILSGWRLKWLISWLGFNFEPDPRSAGWYAEISAVPLPILKDTIRTASRSVSNAFSVFVPYMMIWGDHDLVPLTPRKAGEHDAFVHGRHAAPVESEEEIARIVVAFAGSNECAGDLQSKSSARKDS